MASRAGLESAWRVLIGRPLRASEVAREQITPLEGLPALSLDALTSVAYGPEAIIVVLAAAGAGALHLVILAIVTVLNLRGLGEAARAFLLPTAVFIVGLLVIIAIGLVHPLALHAPQPGHSLLPAHPVEAVSVLLVLKAFSAGCSALTGVEAIANGVPLFKEPRVTRAKRTEMLLGVIL